MTDTKAPTPPIDVNYALGDMNCRMLVMASVLDVVGYVLEERHDDMDGTVTAGLAFIAKKLEAEAYELAQLAGEAHTTTRKANREAKA